MTEYGGRTFITGYHGEKCDIDINECDYTPSICMNNGVCDNQDGTYQCTCDKYSADYEYYTGMVWLSQFIFVIFFNWI